MAVYAASAEAELSAVCIGILWTAPLGLYSVSSSIPAMMALSSSTLERCPVYVASLISSPFGLFSSTPIIYNSADRVSRGIRAQGQVFLRFISLAALEAPLAELSLSFGRSGAALELSNRLVGSRPSISALVSRLFNGRDI